MLMVFAFPALLYATDPQGTVLRLRQSTAIFSCRAARIARSKAGGLLIRLVHIPLRQEYPEAQ